MLVRYGSILLLVCCSLLAGCGGGSSSPAATSVKSTLYVATQANTSVANVAINLNDGTLSSSAANTATGSAPVAIAITPTRTPAGTLAFIANNQCVNGNTNCNSLSRYTVQDDGTLSPLTGATGTGANPVAVAVNPASSLVFVANQGSDSISAFSIQQDGSLLSASGSPFPTFPGPAALTVSPNGKYLYVANSTQGAIAVYTISSSGALSLLPTAPYVGNGASIPDGIAVSADGKFVYVANFGSNNISVFTACIAVTTFCPIADGSLLEVSGSPFALGIGNGTGPGPIAIDPTGNYLFVLNTVSSQMSEFHIGITMVDALTSTATLVPNIPISIATGAGPTSFAIHPTGRWLYTANYRASTVTVFYFDPNSGVLSPSSTPFVTGGGPAAVAVH